MAPPDAPATARPRPGVPMAVRLVVAALVGAFFVASYAASLAKSATFDEPAHIAAGLSYVETGRITLGPEHPPLLKEISAGVLRLVGVRWPTSPEATAALAGDRPAAALVARSIIVRNGPDHVLLWARLPLIVVTTVLVVGVFLLGRRLAGDVAGVGAATLCALDPNIFAHSFLVTTDAGLATAVVCFVVALWDDLMHPTTLRTLIAGLLLGVSLGSKYSAVILPPLAAVLMLAAVKWPLSTPSTGVKDGATERRDGAHSRRKALIRYGVGLAMMCGVAFLVLQVIYLFPSNPFQYLAGWHRIYGSHVEGFQSYMAGRLATRFYSYYVVAYLLKEPLGSIALAMIGLWIVCSDRGMAPLARAFLLVPPAILVAGYTVMSFDIGIRYLLPALPFTHLLGGVAIARAVRSTRRVTRVATAALVGWVVVASVGIYPDELSYFNESACLLRDPRSIGWDGGSRCGPAWLDDSNVDWGQGLKQLKVWLDRNAPGRHIRLGYFGSIPPEAYGISYSPMSDDDLVNGTAPGLYAVSAHIVASTPAVAKQARGGGAEWLRATRPVAIVGHAFYIFDVRGAGFVH
jgi:hypothetical protein